MWSSRQAKLTGEDFLSLVEREKALVEAAAPAEGIDLGDYLLPLL